MHTELTVAEMAQSVNSAVNALFQEILARVGGSESEGQAFGLVVEANATAVEHRLLNSSKHTIVLECLEQRLSWDIGDVLGQRHLEESFQYNSSRSMGLPAECVLAKVKPTDWHPCADA